MLIGTSTISPRYLPEISRFFGGGMGKGRCANLPFSIALCWTMACLNSINVHRTMLGIQKENLNAQ